MVVNAGTGSCKVVENKFFPRKILTILPSMLSLEDFGRILLEVSQKCGRAIATVSKDEIKVNNFLEPIGNLSLMQLNALSGLEFEAVNK